MISSDNKNMQEAGETLYRLNREDQIRYQCEARKEYQRTWNTVKLQIEDYQDEIAELKSAIEEKDSVITEKDSAIMKKDSIVMENDSAIASLEAQIAKLQRLLQNSPESKT